MTDFVTFGWNGSLLPLNPADVDVSGDEDWVTLSGLRKGDTPTTEAVVESLRLAAKLSWLLSSVTVTGAIASNTSSSGGTTNTATGTFGGTATDTPLDRLGVRSSIGTISTSIAEAGVQIFLFAGLSFQRYFDGAVSDPANLVGYGLGPAENIRWSASVRGLTFASRLFGRLEGPTQDAVSVETIAGMTFLRGNDWPEDELADNIAQFGGSASWDVGSLSFGFFM